MNFLKKFGQSILSSLKFNHITPRELQEQIDFHRTAVLLASYTWHRKNEVIVEKRKTYPIPNDDEYEGFWTLADKSTPKEIKENVNLLLDTQIQELFKKLTIYSLELGKKLQKTSKDFVKTEIKLLDTVGFELECRESSIPNSGEGMYIRGEVCTGTVIAFFPGMVHISEYTKDPAYVQALLPDPDHMMIVRTGGILIDARTANQVPSNPYAFGHKINHVPEGVIPNCMIAPFDYLNDPLNIDCFPLNLRHHIPNLWIKPPTFFGTPDRSACMHSLVFLASRPLKDNEELFVDYRLNPAYPHLPPWYVPYEPQEAERRFKDDPRDTADLMQPDDILRNLTEDTKEKK
mmetsp:Transcript_16094/g.15452  ORF Transcript_16094/g.15452 Transcript_16094/m.15452 type:complete len:347 (-) Transcript_16094:52-1092(-)